MSKYDIPLREGGIHHCSDQAEDFCGALLTNGLKDNPHMKYGFVTGTLRVGKAGIFSGPNNLEAFPVLEPRFSGYFGFMEEEVGQIARLYGKEDRYPEIHEWYGGYNVGGKAIFNPWSVLNYFSHDCAAKPYWADAFDHASLAQLLEKADLNVMEDLARILNWKPCQTPVRKYIDAGVSLPDMGKHGENLFSLLVMTGYLTANHVTIHADAPPSKLGGFWDAYLTHPVLFCRSRITDQSVALPHCETIGVAPACCVGLYSHTFAPGLDSCPKACHRRAVHIGPLAGTLTQGVNLRLIYTYKTLG